VNVLHHWQQRVLEKRLPKGAQITLTQRSIFVLPSRFALPFTAALLLILLVAINYRHSLAYGLCFLLLSLFFIALLHSFRNLSGLTIQAQASDAVFAGQTASFRVCLSSNKRDHQSIAIGFSKSSLQILDVPAQSSITVELDYPASRRGWLKPKRLLIESHFPLGLWRVWSQIALQQRVLVYPRPLKADIPLLSGAGDKTEGVQMVAAGVDDFRGLRDFVPGDSLKRLDWKAYSRERGLLIKEFSAVEGGEPWLDFSALEGDSETRLSILSPKKRRQPTNKLPTSPCPVRNSVMKTPPNDALNRSALLWLLLAQALCVVPHLNHLPLWAIFLWLICAFWRIQIYRMRADFPSRAVRILLIVATGCGVYYSRNTLIGLDAAALLLVATFIIKLLELRTRRDAQVIILLGFFVLVVAWLFDDSLARALYHVFVRALGRRFACAL